MFSVAAAPAVAVTSAAVTCVAMSAAAISATRAYGMYVGAASSDAADVGAAGPHRGRGRRSDMRGAAIGAADVSAMNIGAAAGMAAAPTMPTIAAAPTVAMAPGIAAPVPAGSLPAIVIPTEISTGVEELHIFDGCDSGQARPRAEHAIGDRRIRCAREWKGDASRQSEGKCECAKHFRLPFFRNPK